MGRGGRLRAALDRCAERFPIVTHGLALSLGGFEPLDRAYLRDLRDLVRTSETPWHSDHLCFSSAEGAFSHELLPVPFNLPMARHIADRIRRTQDALGVPMAVENISAYALAPGSCMTEAEFISEVVFRADCQLLLDLNNIYVNSMNHGFDAYAMIGALPLDRVCQIHVAGHATSDAVRIDTHAESICEEVFALLEWTLSRAGPKPVLLERDDHFPAWEELCREIKRLDAITKRAVTRFESCRAQNRELRP